MVGNLQAANDGEGALLLLLWMDEKRPLDQDEPTDWREKYRFELYLQKLVSLIDRLPGSSARGRAKTIRKLMERRIPSPDLLTENDRLAAEILRLRPKGMPGYRTLQADIATALRKRQC
jgi:hypothetical protein